MRRGYLVFIIVLLAATGDVANARDITDNPCNFSWRYNGVIGVERNSNGAWLFHPGTLFRGILFGTDCPRTPSGDRNYRLHVTRAAPLLVWGV